MKTKEELREWFWNRFNSCYRIEDHNIKGNYILYYNKRYARKKKIQSLLGSSIKEIYPKEMLSDSIWVFNFDYKNGLLWCSYDEIWSFFKENYSSNHIEIKQLIETILKEDNRFSSLRVVSW